jgi:hypothetical protein
MSDNLWGGTYFGYREGDDLWTHTGKHVGRFDGDEVYGSDGRYLGEIRSGKLISRISSQNRRRGSFGRFASRIGRVPYVNHVGTVMYAGYEDFPGPESFQ